MSTVSKNARGYSRRPLSEHSDVAQNTHHSPAPATGSKRLFSNRESRRSTNSQDHGGNHSLDHLPAEEIHSEKRRRPSDWPLSNTTTPSQAAAPPAPKTTPPQRSRNRRASPPSSHRRPGSSQARPSKFVEGSMNDRVSQKPPTPYLGDEQRLREESARGRKLAQPRKFTHHTNDSTAGSSSADRSEASARHSSIFRFGKSLAASFNPSNWKIWPRQQEQVEEETEQQQVLRERQERAEKIYQELKRTGHFRDSNLLPPTFPQSGDKQQFTPTKHDSGVSFQPSGTMSREEKRMGRVFLEPPHLESRGGSPASNLAESVPRSGASAQKNSFRFRRPSFSNLRNDQGSDSGSIAPEFDDQHVARRIPSRKDLQKQQRLVKRVSDLEGKLEAARRQLCQSLGEPAPPKQRHPRTGRPRFVPGALSTLPSERLLSGYVDPEIDDELSDNENYSQIGRAVTTDLEKDNDVAMHGSGTPYEPKGNVATTSPVQVNKPLPKAPQSPPDQTMDSVESDSEEASKVNVPASKANGLRFEVLDSGNESAPSSQPTTRSSYQAEASPEKEAAASLSDASESEFEPTREPIKKPAPKHQAPAAPARTKKRKSTFERERDGSGTYRPPPKSESSIGSRPSPKKMRSAPKNAGTGTGVTAARPRKLQKVVGFHEDATSTIATSGSPPSKEMENELPATPIGGGKTRIKYRVTPKPKTTTNARPGSRLSKAKPGSSMFIDKEIGQEIGRERQSMSPPPTSSFTGGAGGLSYHKPSQVIPRKSLPGYMISTARENGKGSATKDVTRGTEPMYSAIPSTEADVPPMPKLPRKVRLPSGEVVSTSSASFPASASTSTSQAVNGYGKLTKSRPVAAQGEGEKGGNGMKRDESFEWGDDVF